MASRTAALCMRSWRFLGALARAVNRVVRRGGEVVHSGLWLGIIHETTCEELDRLYYRGETMYREPKYNTSGLFPWEASIVERVFAERNPILVAAAGGGREVIGLSRLGHRVDGFEYNQQLAESGNRLLKSLGLDARIIDAQRDRVPPGLAQYQGAIVGWGAFSLIQSKAVRTGFLAEMRALLPEDAPLLLSFFHRKHSSLGFRVIAALANLLRTVTRRQHVEVGDALAPNCVHFFTRGEIEQELAAAGFHLIDYFVEPDAHAVAEAGCAQRDEPAVDITGG